MKEKIKVTCNKTNHSKESIEEGKISMQIQFIENTSEPSLTWKNVLKFLKELKH